MYITGETQSKFEKPVTIAYCLALLCEGLVTSIFGASMVYLADRTHSAISEISILIIFYNVGFIFSSLFIARLYDVKPGNRMIGTGIFMQIAVLIGLCLMRSRWVLFLLAVVMGLAHGIIENGPNILVPWLLGSRGKRTMNFMLLFLSLGSVITPLLIGVSLRKWNSITPVLILLAVLIFYPAVNLLRLPSPKKAEVNIQSGASWEKKSSYLKAAFLFGILLFLLSSGLATINNWMSTVLVNNRLTDTSGAAMMTSIVWVGCVIGRLIGAWLAGNTPSEKIVIGGLMIAIVDGIAMFFFRENLFLIGLCVLINGISTGPIMANILTMTKERGYVSGEFNGIILAFNQLGCMLLPVIFGRIWGDSTSSYVPFVAITLGASAGELLLLQFIIASEKKRGN